MTELDPSRYSAVLRTEVPAEEAASVADMVERTFQDARPARRLTFPRLTRQQLGGLCIAAAVLVLMAAFLRADVNSAPGPARNRLGVSSGNIFSDSALGAEVRVSDYVPSHPTARPTTAAAVVTATAHEAPVAATRAPVERPRLRREADVTAPLVESPEDKWEVLFDDHDEPEGSIVVPAAEPPAPIVVNIGERIAGRLTHPLVTGAGTVPVTVTVMNDVLVGEKVAIPAGARLDGEGFATTANDRVQVLFHAVVIGGRTIRVSAVAFGDDNELGLGGKVVKKGSPLKSVGGRVAGAFGRALSYAGYASGYGGPLSDATVAGNLVSGAASDLQKVGGDWVLSSKVVKVSADKRLVVYFAGDVYVNASELAALGLGVDQ
jgi:hypothetical protein